MEASDVDPCTVLDRVAPDLLHTEHLLDGNWKPIRFKVDSGGVMVCVNEVDKVIETSVQCAVIALVQKVPNGKNKSTSSSSFELKCYEYGDPGHMSKA